VSCFSTAFTCVRSNVLGFCASSKQIPIDPVSQFSSFDAVEKQDTGKDAFVWIGDAAKDADKWVSGVGNDMGQPARDAISWVKGAANSTL
jgi:hypothetical protein